MERIWRFFLFLNTAFPNFFPTDIPYLAPEPVRGTRNDPRNVKYIAEKIANVKNISLEDVANFTFSNVKKIFGI